MATKPRLQTEMLPSVSEDGGSATASPARGKEMRNQLFNRLRVPELVHTWEFWHEKPGAPAEQQQQQPPPAEASTTKPEALQPSHSTAATATTTNSNYSVQLSPLLTISDVKAFWSLYNNFDFLSLPRWHSVHLFHTHTKPIWEDTRNARGGAWNFRVGKANSPQVWRDISLLAVGEQLQQAVSSDREGRKTFRDDICGISYRPKANITIISVWNRDADHEEGKERVLSLVLEKVPRELWPAEGNVYYYKKHAEQEGFNANMAGVGHNAAAAGAKDGEANSGAAV